MCVRHTCHYSSKAYNADTHSHFSFLTSCVYVALSQAVVEAGAVPLLVLSLQEPEMALKRIAASTLSDICKHTPQLAQTVVDTGAIAHLAQMILNPDAKLKVGPNANAILLNYIKLHKHIYFCLFDKDTYHTN